MLQISYELKDFNGKKDNAIFILPVWKILEFFFFQLKLNILLSPLQT